MPPSDPPASASPAERDKNKSKDERKSALSDDDDESSSITSIDAFSLETVLTDARRDVTAVTGWGPDAALVALDGGCLLVLRRDHRNRGPKGEASNSASSSSSISTSTSTTSTAAVRKSVPTTTAGGSASTTSTSALADAALPWRLVAAHSHLASKRIAQLEVVSSGVSGGSGSGGRGGEGGGSDAAAKSQQQQQLLLALTEEGVTAFRLPGFTMTAQADRTAGSSRFAWQPGPRLLAVVAGGGSRRTGGIGGMGGGVVGGGGGGGSKKVSIFRHDGKEFVPLRELNAPEQPLAVAWAGPCVLVSGSSGSWWALRPSSSSEASSASSSQSLPATEEILPSSTSPSSSAKDGFTPLACPFSFSSSSSSSSGGSGFGTGDASSPSAASAAVSLGRRGAALVAADGRPARGGRCPSLWRGAGAPAALAGSPPWLCAALPGGVEARPLDPTLSPDLLCQTLPLACMTVASSSCSRL